ncbi:MAG TPA: histidine kinase dimerization/phospho-acceptor domain-containing protein, partial [Tissierellaceae bacterium]
MRKRLLTNFIFVLLISAVVSGALAYSFIKTSYLTSKEEKLMSNINLIMNSLDKMDINYTEKSFYKLSQELSNQINSRVTFITSDGRVLADSINNSIIFKDFKVMPEYKYAIRGDRQIVQRYSLEVGRKYSYLAMPPIKLGNLDVIVRLGEDFEEIDVIIETFLSYAFMSTFVGLVFAIIVGYISAGRIVKPVKELTEASKIITDGNLDKRVYINTNDEIEDLSMSFNRMINKLNYTIGELKDKNTETDAILASMQEGLIAVNNEKKVILINDMARRIFTLSTPIKLNCYIDQLEIDEYIISLIEYGIENNIELDREVEITNIDKEKMILNISTSIIQSKGNSKNIVGTLIMIRDVTSIRKLEKMRQDFVANVSHELRTPLTSIGGFVETLKIQQLDETNKKRALEIIEFETERLKILINDLLKLSEIENLENVKSPEIVDINTTCNKVVSLLKPQMEEKNITFTLNIE